ncbi:hypothetical protein C8F04DRAFT_1198064 [Mycena alexandri]|uniref:Uncharacterized protein n=1 Tax=Mycena alexandri TaxID=1745969 RepID=A0AAD6S0S0_9AGAR|nr:hypothetical protein C8F04DRAFT_1198064 [Mycena alexandri]
MCALRGCMFLQLLHMITWSWPGGGNVMLGVQKKGEHMCIGNLTESTVNLVNPGELSELSAAANDKLYNLRHTHCILVLQVVMASWEPAGLCGGKIILLQVDQTVFTWD